MEEMATVSAPYITPEEYLERERRAETKSEYLGGQVFTMAGGSLRHARIITSLVRRLADQLSGRPCDVYSTNVRLSIPGVRLYTYPDVMVVCGESTLTDDRQDTLTNPVVIIEVLSESTKSYDCGQKFHYYRTLSSLMEYLTVAQDEIQIEHWTKQKSSQWLLSEYNERTHAVALPSLSIELKVLQIYENVEFAKT